ncbi:unnamed protein product [Microthlaspi erraticum]|uniref:CCHC-type domain-containing protein n=1 Tax=Microthlaspi erraticum TaxID=1685480 RepID=A0A6D2K8Y9_9BRAS|nr:unnamed protein product [Microthlaspi erraticum]
MERDWNLTRKKSSKKSFNSINYCAIFQTSRRFSTTSCVRLMTKQKVMAKLELKVDLDLKDGDGFIAVSDRHKGLVRAIKIELPKMEHRKCVRHIYGNLKKKHGSKKQMKQHIWRLAWSYNEAKFQVNLDRAFYKLGNYCEDVENNSTESFNSSINKAREKPFIPMLEAIARLAMARIAEVRHNRCNIRKPNCQLEEAVSSNTKEIDLCVSGISVERHKASTPEVAHVRVHTVRWTELLEVVAREGAVLEAVAAELVVELEAEQAESVPLEGDASASVGLEAGAAPGGGGAPAPGREDLVVGLLTQLLTSFPPVVAQGAPGVPPVAEVQHVAADFVQPEAVGAGVSRYLEFMGHMQRIGTPFFEGRVGPEEADVWRQRVERNFHSICCPMEYWVELAVHSLSGDAHLWWQAAVGRRTFWTWGDFLVEFNAKYFPRQARDRLQMQFMDIEQGERTVREYDAEFSRLLMHAGFGMEAEHQLMNRFLEGLRKDIRTLCKGGMNTSRAGLVELAASVEAVLSGPFGPMAVPSAVAPATQPRGAVLPTQGHKRGREEFSGASQFRRGSCFGCGSTEHRVSSCPKRESAPRVCYYYKEPGHIKPMCPKLRSMSVASVQPVAAQPVSRIAAVQPLGHIAPAPRGYSSVETGGTSQTEQITGTLLVGGFESHVIFDSGASNCFITSRKKNLRRREFGEAICGVSRSIESVLRRFGAWVRVWWLLRGGSSCSSSSLLQFIFFNPVSPLFNLESR